MSTDISNSPGSPNDELDLGQLFTLIKKGFLGVFKFFLRLFVYVRNNIIWLIVLSILGAALGIGLNKISARKLKTEVIVSPNLKSKNYLYDAVNEINGKIKAKDTAFFASLDVGKREFEKFEVTVVPVSIKIEEDLEADIKYLEALEPFQNSQATADIIRNLLIDQNSFEQRVTFFYRDPISGPVVARKLIDYINSNDYYRKLVDVYNANDRSRLLQNDSILGQIDELINTYTTQMNANDQAVEGQLVISEEEELDIPQLFTLKNTLITQSEFKRVELQQRTAPLGIVNFGQSQLVKIPLFGKSIFLIPLIFIGIFILIDIIKYLNKKSRELLPE
ncbi:MAG: hypothetical protein OEQ81_00695 [Flavobacteriaceae bacterium]|nr:hypothetical protein [Flavobacteriaceae bacterium]